MPRFLSPSFAAPPPLLLLFLLVVSPTFAASKLDFARDVRPILSNRCFKCHGPDEATRKGNLRLDLRESALNQGKSGEIAIVPNQPSKSELVRRLHADDPDERMPPASAKMELSSEEKRILEQWIAEGAEYRPHWAFIPPVKSSQAHSIDQFIRQRLTKENLSPSPPASKHQLIRRVTLDLIGIPPSIEEIHAFVNDSAPDAYDRLVDRLLASPHYGERWARRWLDLARYADTNGYEKDRERQIWPWRDWVIRAIIADLPFDQFTIKQLAGDMLPNASTDDHIATGFHRNSMLNEEGGNDPLEFRYHAMADRVATTGSTWLGLTLSCAQCHTHKYDPILHTEYFGIMAFLNNADDVYQNLPNPNHTAQQQARFNQAESLIAKLPQQWPIKKPTQSTPLNDTQQQQKSIDQAFQQWLIKLRNNTIDWHPLTPTKLFSNEPTLTVEPDHAIIVSGDTTKDDHFTLTFANIPAGTTQLRLEALSDERLPGFGPGNVYYEGKAGDFFLYHLSMLADGKPVSFADANATIGDAKLAVDDDNLTGWTIRDGTGKDQTAVFHLSKPLPATKHLVIELRMGRYFASTLGKFRLSISHSHIKSQARALPAELETALASPNLSPLHRQQLFRHFLLTTPPLADAAKPIHDLLKPLTPPRSLTLRERRDHPRTTRLHTRGEFTQPAQPVQPHLPAFLASLTSHQPANRLEFAQWLVSKDNPLTARVIVNRHWQTFFGSGLVATLDDFGLQGESPSHPQLLDWLAVSFMENNWSIKQLHRLIVTSDTYRQDSKLTLELLAKDPQNRLLARGPRQRLDAELIRDLTLTAAGLLSSKQFGPSVRPPQPDSVTEGAYGGMSWPISKGEDRYRRGLYTFAKRSAPYASFQAFDAPTGEACVARREVSNTPLQSLVLLNDEVFFEAAQALGKLTSSHPGSVEDKISFAFQRCLTRPPTAEESAKLVYFYQHQLHRIQSGQLSLNQLMPANSTATQAAWMTVARVLLNLDETIVSN